MLRAQARVAQTLFKGRQSALAIDERLIKQHKIDVLCRKGERNPEATVENAMREP